ncbi:hypothetical protein DXG01_000397 [Tephrocybe rancida]|nr:hypothetical protein DXG01_000397 [Tephrocybe rancida]
MLLEIDYKNQCHTFCGKRIRQEVSGDSLGAEWVGYLLRITGGNVIYGVPISHAIVLPPRPASERRRRAIVRPDISALVLYVVGWGEADVPELTDTVDVGEFVIRREVKSKEEEEARAHTKA